MSDTPTPQTKPRVTGELEEAVKETKSLARKWIGIASLIIVSGSAGGVLRNCFSIGAGLVGVQTEAKAKEQFSIVDDRHKSHEAANIQSHNDLWQAVGEIKGVAEDAKKAAEEVQHGMPESWRKRAARRKATVR